MAEKSPSLATQAYETIKENITLAPIKLLGKSKEEADKRAMELLERVGLAEKADSYPSQLSGGQKQRLSIARAFLKDAPIILLDEATASLDVDNETMIQESLSRLIKNKTVMIIAHRMRTVADADKIVVLKDGVVAESGAPELR